MEFYIVWFKGAPVSIHTSEVLAKENAQEGSHITKVASPDKATS